jgi:hypothetical protein
MFSFLKIRFIIINNYLINTPINSMDLYSRNYNTRFIETPVNESRAKIMGTLLWIASISYYKHKIYPQHKNYLNLVFFAAGSYVASYGYALTLKSNPYYGACERNNAEEREHQKNLGNL